MSNMASNNSFCESTDDPRLCVVKAAVLDLECRPIEHACGILEAQPTSGKRQFALGWIAGGSPAVSAST